MADRILVARILILMFLLLVVLYALAIFAYRELRDLWSVVNSISQTIYQVGKATRQLAERLRKLEDDGK